MILDSLNSDLHSLVVSDNEAEADLNRQQLKALRRGCINNNFLRNDFRLFEQRLTQCVVTL